MMLTISSIWLRPPPVLQGLGNDLRLAMRRVLRSGGPNHSKPAVFIVFSSEIEQILANPRVLTLWA